MKTFLTARWEDLIMANYEVPEGVLLPYLPKGVLLDKYEGKCLVSLVGFMFAKIRIFGVPIPLLGTFEEINLRFYVKRIEGDEIKRGVVFIGETVPFAPVAWLANALYKEKYFCIPTKHKFGFENGNRSIQYAWKKKQWNSLEVKASVNTSSMPVDGIEEFIFEHYYGYTKTSDDVSQEYRVNHPRWQIHNILSHKINCDFKAMYGNEFSFLNTAPVHSIIMADGSAVSIDWKRIKF